MNRDYFNFIIIGSYKKSPEQLLGLHDFSHSLKYRSKIDFLVIFNESTCFSLIKILTESQCQLAFQIDSSFNACARNETKSIPIRSCVQLKAYSHLMITDLLLLCLIIFKG